MAGEMVHLEIPASDTGRSKEFWGSLFGWQFEQFPGPTEYHMAQIDERSGVAIEGGAEGRKGPRVVFAVDAIEEGAARVRELGGEAGEPGSVPGMGWYAYCTDPDGNEFGIWQTDESAPMPEM